LLHPTFGIRWYLIKFPLSTGYDGGRGEGANSRPARQNLRASLPSGVRKIMKIVTNLEIFTGIAGKSA
jgi:hypothetical protein